MNSSSLATASASNTPLNLPPPSSLVTTITPAALSSLAIYNPSLGPTEKSVHDQIVFYTSRKGAVTSDTKLREIGLAQGIVEFARGFSKNENLSSIETQKSRIVTLEIEESGWWILAQIDLTYIHNPSTYPPTIEYSSREVAPPVVLLAQIRQAYNQFRFHYGGFAQNYAKLGRTAFCKRLEKYWLRWVWGRWEVILHGSPATIALGNGGIKMVGGRPGKEIGEEERKFLTEWAEKEKVRGMVDMVAFRFGDYVEELDNAGKDKREGQSGYWFWGNTSKAVAAAMSTSTLPKGRSPKGPGLIMPQDGCIFPGTGALETHSVRDITTYISELYQYGDEISPRSGGRRQRKHQKRPKGLLKTSSSERSAENIPIESLPKNSTPTTKPTGEGLGATPSPIGPDLKPSVEEAVERKRESRGRVEDVSAEDISKSRSPSSTNAKIFNLLTFGWSGGSTKNAVENTTSATTSSPEPEPELTPPPPPMTNVDPIEHIDEGTDLKIIQQDSGNDNGGNKKARFVIGFLGDVYAEDLDDDLQDEHSTGKITSRTVWAERRKGPEDNPSNVDIEIIDCQGKGKRRSSEVPVVKQTSMNLEEFRIVVYTNHPFIFAFIFEASASQLTSPAFYRALHHQLAPLHGPLLKSSKLIDSAGKGSSKSYGVSLAPQKPPYDFLYNPSTRMIYSTVPPIPEPGPDFQNGWTRAEAFHVHTLILGILSETMGDRAEQERSARSTKGWWINWMRLEGGEEGVVVRRAGEKTDLVAGLVGASGTAGAGVGGVDIRKYFEGLVRGVR